VSADALVRVIDRHAPGHEVAAALWRIEFDAGSTLLTTVHGLVKAAREIQCRHGVDGVRTLLEVAAPALHVEWCTREDFDLAATALLAAGSEESHLDLVDHIDLQVCRRLRVRAGFLL
jgi:hypothetical protein